MTNLMLLDINKLPAENYTDFTNVQVHSDKISGQTQDICAFLIFHINRKE
jgi:hypothetical protein